MTTYRELLKQREALQKQIEAAREREQVDAIAKVREIIDEFSLTPEQVFPRGRSGRGRSPVKYFDPVSGATWSGRGREPLWIKGQLRERFLLVSKPPQA